MYDGGGVVCVYLCRYFIDVRGCGCRATILSGTYDWSLVVLTDLGVSW